MSTKLTPQDRVSFTMTAKTVRTAQQAYDLAEKLLAEVGIDYRAFVKTVEQEALVRGYHIFERDAAERSNIAYSTMRRFTSCGEFPKPDQVTESRIAHNKFTLCAYQMMLLAWNDLQHATEAA